VLGTGFTLAQPAKAATQSAKPHHLVGFCIEISG
jgi:hypothetical protein